MYYNSFPDSCLRLQYSPLQPEVIYRCYAPPLTYLNNVQILRKTKETADGFKLPIANTIAPIQLQEPGHHVVTKGLVAPFGQNSTQVEIIGVGGQNLRSQSSDEAHLNPSTVSSLDQCFQDVVEAEYPFCTINPYKDESQDFFSFSKTSRTFTISSDTPSDYLERTTSSLLSCSKENFNKLFRFKRLAEFYPRSLNIDPITEILIDDKLPYYPYIYVRNQHGLVISQLHVKEQKETDLFPHIQPTVIADLDLIGDEVIATMFVSPHEFGIFGAITWQRQLMIWDSTISSPIHKVNLFRSTQSRMTSDRALYRQAGCIATENIECATFTDRSDCVLVGGKKLYIVDLRSRVIGDLFPSRPKQVPMDYYIPRLQNRGAYPDYFTSISQHPICKTLYAIISSSNNSIILWDLRKPSSIIEELPLPLVQQGRGRYRSLKWHPVESPTDDGSSYLLSSFCSDYHLVTVNLLSIYDSTNMIQMAGHRAIPRHHCRTGIHNNIKEMNLHQTGVGDVTRKSLSKATVEKKLVNDGSICNEDHRSGSIHSSSHKTIEFKGESPIHLDECLDESSQDEHQQEPEGLLIQDLQGDHCDEDHLMFSDEEEDEKQMMEQTTKNDGREERLHQVTQGVECEEEQQPEILKFWFHYHEDKKKGYSPFFVDPFVKFPSPSKFDLPVCDVTGLCFASSRPPIQVVVYPQVQLPLGIPSLVSELQYFSTLGPLLSSSDVLLNEGLHAPVSEAAISQLFVGLFGHTFMTLDIPIGSSSGMDSNNNNNNNRLNTNSSRSVSQKPPTTITYQRRTVALALTSSGRLLSLILDVVPQQRQRLFNNNSESNIPDVVDRTMKYSISKSEPKGSQHIINEILQKLNFPSTSSCLRPGPVPTFRQFSELIQKGLHDEMMELSKKIKPEKDLRINWSLIPEIIANNLGTILYDKGEGNIKSRSSNFMTLFGERLSSLMRETSCRSLHEYLRCNNDTLFHPSFAMGRHVHYTRLKMETLPYWRHPELDSMYWSEALLDLLIGALSPTADDAPILIRSIGWKHNSSVVENSLKHHGRDQQHLSSPVSSLSSSKKALKRATLAEEDLLAKLDCVGYDHSNEGETDQHTKSDPTLHKALTLGEMLADCQDNVVADKEILKLHEAVLEKKVIHWVSNTGALDREDTGLLPFPSKFSNSNSCLGKIGSYNQTSFQHRGEHELIWRAVPEKTITPLCSCVSLKAKKPLVFTSENGLTHPQFMLPLPKDEPILLKSIGDALDITANKVRRRRSLEKPVCNDRNDSFNCILNKNDPTVSYLTNSLMESMMALPVIRSASGSAEAEKIHAVGLQCDLLHPTCNMKDFHVYRKRSIDENESLGCNIIQGRHFLDVSKEVLDQLSTEDKQHLLENEPREYPRYYGQLKGVRITTTLYEKLRKEWVPLPIRGEKNENVPLSSIFNPVKALMDIPLTQTQLKSSPVDVNCSVSSSFTLPFSASIELNEEKALQEEAAQKRAMDAISSQMTTCTSSFGARKPFLMGTSRSGGEGSSSIIMRHLLHSSSSLQTPLTAFTENVQNANSLSSTPRTSLSLAAPIEASEKVSQTITQSFSLSSSKSSSHSQVLSKGSKSSRARSVSGASKSSGSRSVSGASKSSRSRSVSEASKSSRSRSVSRASKSSRSRSSRDSKSSRSRSVSRVHSSSSEAPS